MSGDLQSPLIDDRASEGTFSENAHTLNLKDKKLGLTKVLEKIHEANIELLHTLILSNCDLDLDSLTELLRVFGQLSALKVLDLSKNPFGDKGAAVIIEWMKTNKTITSLSLSALSLTADTMQILADMLKENKILRSLSLEHNNLNEECIKILCGPLTGPDPLNTTLEELSLSGNVLAEHCYKTIADMLRTNPNIRKIDLSWTQLTYSAAAALAEAIPSCSLSHLSASISYWGARGVTAIANAMEKNNTILVLDIGSPHEEDKAKIHEAMRHVARMLEVNTTLQDFGLYSARLDCEAATILSQGIENAKHLKVLRLFNNNIGREGGISLAKALIFNQSITRLELFLNEIDDEAARVFADMLNYNTTLEELILYENCITTAGALEFAKALANNETLKLLDLRDNEDIDANEFRRTYAALSSLGLVPQRKVKLTVLL